MWTPLFITLCDDKYEIKEYIYKFFLPEYILEILDIASQYEENFSKDNLREFLERRPIEFPEHIKAYFDKQD